MSSEGERLEEPVACTPATLRLVSPGNAGEAACPTPVSVVSLH